MMPTDLTKKKSKPSAIRPREASSFWKIKLGKIFIKQLYIKIEEISSHMLAKGKHYMTIYIYIYILKILFKKLEGQGETSSLLCHCYCILVHS